MATFLEKIFFMNYKKFANTSEVKNKKGFFIMVDGISSIGGNNDFNSKPLNKFDAADELQQLLFEHKTQKTSDDFNIKGLTLEKSSAPQDTAGTQKLQSLLAQSKLSDLQNADDVKNFIENLENNGFNKVDFVTDKSGKLVEPEGEIYKNLKTGERVVISNSGYALEKTITYKKGNMSHTIKMMRDREGNPTGNPYSGTVTVKNSDGSKSIYNYSYNEQGSSVLNDIKIQRPKIEKKQLENPVHYN